jgi:pimeloyl-ACP methyl ester carboxylesterase
MTTARQDVESKDTAEDSLANSAPTQTIQAAGVTFAYRSFGVRAATPLVLLHRFRATMDDWDPAFLDALAARRTVIVFDNAGVGLSSGETPESIPAMATYAGALIDALGLGSVDILGWSMGGFVALTLALARPGLVRRVVIAGSGPGGVPNAPMAPAKVWEVAPKPVNDDEDFLYLFFPHTSQGRAEGRKHLARLNKRVDPPIPPTRPESYAAMLTALKGGRGPDSTYPRLRALEQPVLFANGVHDIMVSAYNSYAAVERLPNGKLILYPAAGHAFLFQYYEAFTGDVHRFLDA